MIWFSSDQHFGDAKCLHGRHRPFSSVDEMNSEMVRLWNEAISPDDEVYLLGDFAVTEEAVEEFFPQLNGDISLVMGNYESTMDPQTLRCRFNIVWEKPQMIDTYINGEFTNLFLCHYPVQRHPDVFTIAGHVHELWRVAKNMVNVGVDAWHFRPVSMDMIEECIGKQEGGNWDANVYPDAPLSWRLSQSTKRQRFAGEPTLDILRAEAFRSSH